MASAGSSAAASPAAGAAAAALPLQQRRVVQPSAGYVGSIRATPTAGATPATRVAIASGSSAGGGTSPNSRGGASAGVVPILSGGANASGSCRMSPASATPTVLYPGTPSPMPQQSYSMAGGVGGAGGLSFGVPVQVPYMQQAPMMMQGAQMPMMAGQPGMPGMMVMPQSGAVGANPGVLPLPVSAGQHATFSDASANAAAVSVQTGMVDDASAFAAPMPAGGYPSVGSALHDGTGRCSPCAWFWKPRGCQSGANCGYCHLCPEGELKNRKKAKVAAIRMGYVEPARTQGAANSRAANLKLTTLL